MLKKGAAHVDYEVDQLMRTAERLRDSRLPDDPTVRRAVLESWAVHLRCLIEFFHPTQATRSDTVIAKHYVIDLAQWNNALPELTAREKRRREALHQLLAHISYKRDARKSRWSERDHRIITRRVPVFLQHISSRRKDWFPKAVRWFDSE